MKIDNRLGHVESKVGLLAMLASVERSDFKMEKGKHRLTWKDSVSAVRDGSGDEAAAASS